MYVALLDIYRYTFRLYHMFNKVNGFLEPHNPDSIEDLNPNYEIIPRCDIVYGMWLNENILSDKILSLLFPDFFIFAGLI